MNSEIISSKVELIPESATIQISDIVAQLKSEGKDVISFSLGEPDFKTPQRIIEAAEQSLNRGETHYTQSKGVPELRDAITEKLKADNKLAATSDDILVTPGAKQAIFEAICTLLNEGDEAVLFDPAWVSYEAIVKFAGGKPTMVPVYERNGYQPVDFQDFVNNKTKLIILNSPCNPTGAVYDKPTITAIAEIAEDYGLYVISDEVYEKIIYDGEHFSIGTLIPDLTITVNGFSKAYAMTGWRLGYALAPKIILKGMLKIQQHSVSHPTSFVQYAGIEALTGDQQPVYEMTAEFRIRRDLVIDELSKIGTKCRKPSGAFYAFIDVSKYGTSIEVTERLLRDAYVAVTPGSAFGPNGEGYVRLSYAASREQIVNGIKRMSEVLMS
ncbi:MAG: pyridoxal phosphate-dependent aminotransferase [Halobacteriota archaeon]